MENTASSYVVLARKWRPAQFADIVGQNPVVRTLINAIRANRVHQAYLFTGSRGIGKTSIARIFAKALRCEHTSDETKDGVPWLKSCDRCSSCKEITASTSVDVIEIDGASNNGVEAVREIRENAKYMPSNGSRKIYIIDEVHMLTTAAFNALLKTLEEPPAHVIFIFATTEPHKIPATILSRVQRFDFRRVTTAQIQARVAEVTKAEGIATESGALALIARAAEGSMRDALSLLDQVIAFSGDKLSVESVRESVGLIEGQTVLGILAGILERKPLEALALVEQAYQRGHDLRVLGRSLIEFLHGAVLAKVGAPNSALLELSDEEWKELKSLSETRELEEIELIFQVMHHGLEAIARSPQPKIVLDILVVKCATADALVSISDGGARGGPASSERPASTAPRAAAPSPRLQASPEMAAHASSAPVAASFAHAIAEKISAPRVAAQPEAPVSAPAPTTPTEPAEDASRSFEGFIAHVRKSRPLLGTILEHGSCSEGPWQPGKSALVIGYGPDASLFREQLQSNIYHGQLLAFAREYFGQNTHVQVESIAASAESPAAKKKREAHEREQATRERAQNHPILREAKSLFGGELGPIEITMDELSGENHANA